MSASAALLSGCTSGSAGTSPDRTGPLTLVSSAFAQNGTIPIDFSCAGENTSPPLTWRGATPPGTSSWALVMTDPDVRPGPWIQWIVTGIPVRTRTVSANAFPAAAQVASASNGTHGYVGVCPPQGTVHHYAFALYAIGRHLSLSTTAPAARNAAEIAHAAVASAKLVADFAR